MGPALLSRGSIRFVCFVAGAAAFIRFFVLATRLNRERVGPPASRTQRLFPWLPGRFTTEGCRVRRRMNVLLAVGWILLILGVALS